MTNRWNGNDDLTPLLREPGRNPQNDAQALARAHRIGQTKPVQVYRLVMRGTYERDMLDRAAMKLGLEQAIFGACGLGKKPRAAPAPGARKSSGF
jgi:SNF2 family DNA or RNA helicase